MPNQEVIACLPPSSQVHTLETASHAPTEHEPDTLAVVRSLEIEYRHAATAHRRARIRRAHDDAGTPRERLERWEECGRFATVERSKDNEQKYRLNCSRCHDRFCPACGAERSRIVSQNAANELMRKQTRFITLTVRHHDEDLKALLIKLLTSFKKLRRTNVWLDSVKGGAAFLEVKVVNGWHPHLHIIVEGCWIDKKQLSREWLRITTDSSIIDVREVKDVGKVAHYVAKYASKPLDRSVINNHARLVEAIVTLRGTKTIITFGTWRKVKLTEKNSDEVWETVATLKQLLEREKEGDHVASEIMNALRSQIQCRRERQGQEESDESG